MSRRELAPPTQVIDVARCTMGAIDLDPWSTPEVNRLVQAARFFERDRDVDRTIERHWTPAGGKRVLLAVPTGVGVGRDLANKLLREYRGGHIDQAILWFGSNEVIASCPWVWDFPVCIPFRRLAPCFWHDELEKPVRVSPADWSPIIYLPTASPSETFRIALARFHAAAAPLGRVVLDEWSGENRWQASYRSATGKDYSCGA